jgi:predicted amidohydrolase
MEYGPLRDASLIAWPAGGGARRVIRSGILGGKPHFSAEAGVAHVQMPNGLTPVDLASGEVRPAYSMSGPGWYFVEGPVPVDDSRISPDGSWMLALVAQQLHLLAVPPAGQSVDLSRPGVAHRRITDVGADFFEWADGGKTITWAVGSTFHRRALQDIPLNPANEPDWSAAPQGRGVEAFTAVVEVPRDVATGSLVLRGARVITMRGQEAIENADLVVKNGRIVSVGAKGSVSLPAGATVRDVSGRTIVPGFIDIHDHVADIRRDVLSADAWGLRARLSYGITTAFDPSSLSIDMLAYQDMVDAGMVLGARVPTTGMAMFSFNRLASPDEARALLRRYRDHYRTHNVKQYLIGNRRERQWLVQAAAELGVMPTTEGSLALKLDLGQIMDGYAGSEHALPTPLYRDVIELVARSGTSYDATLQISNGGPAAQDHFVIRDDPLSDAKFLRTRPAPAAAQSVGSRRWASPQLFLYPRIGGDAARIQRAGGVVGMGSHGDIPGPGFHWEMEAHVQGGMTPWEALRAGTLGSAEAIGRAAEFGSIEPGKVADLVILADDPRGDIRRSSAVVEVMKNGRLHAADTLDEVWPRQRPAPPAWFSGDRPEAR